MQEKIGLGHEANQVSEYIGVWCRICSGQLIGTYEILSISFKTLILGVDLSLCASHLFSTEFGCENKALTYSSLGNGFFRGRMCATLSVRREVMRLPLRYWHS
jgi:hypothetical protein